MNWRESGREQHGDRVYVMWRCHECRRRAVTIGSDKPTACCCWSPARNAGPSLGRDPSAGRARP